MIRQCPECGKINMWYVLKCSRCGYEFDYYYPQGEGQAVPVKKKVKKKKKKRSSPQ